MDDSPCGFLPFVKTLWPDVQVHNIVMGSFVQSFTELFNEEWGVAVVLKSCRQIVESYNVIVNFVAFLFKSIKLTHCIFFDCCVDETVDKGFFKIISESFIVA